jgi:hypothetical protein
MIIERKVIDKIIENAKMSATTYQLPASKSATYAIDFFVAGNQSAIPEAKYDGGDAPAIPGTESKKN